MAESDNVSIHALREECDRERPPQAANRPQFQSTHSVKSATLKEAKQILSVEQFQSTHSVKSATEAWAEAVRIAPVSIHALREECDSRPLPTRP